MEFCSDAGMVNRMVERLLAPGTLPTVSKPKLTRTRIILAFAVSVIADVFQFPISSMDCPQGA
jgi:DNA mismatch repair ATPase MutS